MFISEHTSSGMSVNIDIELIILSMLYNQTYILYLISCTYYIKHCILLFIIIISGTLYTHTALLVKILYVLVVLVISPLGFKRISTVTIMYLLYSVNVYIFNVVIEIKFYSILFYKT